ncbi:hypothetical protein SG1650 [Sodalis glossinidius str. 'morsitans']|uniref:Uncharacterized protein n=1 Tax=Sodalis glossinidius (strain morsitans) TaxID=343509 RepID=Q2NSF0_SODGM|nr:hypothetical protein [Sodalis glossinidius]BAE74925.1 hypothetical protein SG1650 [Sodalis glossinidius str. 'morsitans']
MNISDLDDKYGQYGFIKSDLEYLLGFYLNSDVKPLPDYLYPYKTRFGITIKESANIMAGFKPMDNVTVVDKAELFHAYLDSLWDAVDNGLLNATKIEEEYYNDEKYRVNAILIKDEVTIWAEKNNIQWPFGVEERSGGGEKTKESTDDIIKRLMAENEKLKNEISEVRELLPILLKTYRDDDPLTLEIEIRREN